MTRLKVVSASITTLDVDAIVNAANSTLLGGGGVDGAIHEAAGPELLAACRTIPEVAPLVRCPTGEVRLTPGFRLPARWVIHAVGPIWRNVGNEPELLAACYRNSLTLCAERGLQSVAFPAISTGVYGFPGALAAQIAVRECLAFFSENETPSSVSLVAFSRRDEDFLNAALGQAK